MLENKRLQREKRTVKAMITLYCQNLHQTMGICPSCQELLDYAFKRIDSCRFGEQKPTCGQCMIHCYKPDRRDQIRSVMRYSGPRMIYRHPAMAIRHVLDRKRL